MYKEFTLKKDERIHSKKEIEQLFSEGESFIAFPLRVVYLLKKTDESYPVSMLVNISKKKFKQAVKRNRLKRLIRESYRLNKNELVQLLDFSPYSMIISFLYVGQEIKNYQEVEKGMKKALGILKNKVV